MIKIKYIKKFKNQTALLENFSYITLLQIFIIISPLITYPYLIRVVGKELYGWVVTAQVLVSYATIIINFGTNSVCAKHVSISRDNKDKLSEILSSVFWGRLGLAIISFLIYLAIVLLIPSYRDHLLLFLLSYGLTFDALLFPQYFFQGIEKMKISSLINIGIKLFFILLIFTIVKDPEDYLLIPSFYSIGYIVAGIVSLTMISRKFGIRLSKPSWDSVKLYLKESSPLFATDIVCTIKDKLNYFLLGAINMGEVVVYDLGVKLTAMLAKPGTIISTVLFPRFAKNRSVDLFKRVLLIELIVVALCVILVNIFMPFIVEFLIGQKIDILPLRVFSLAPIFLTVSSHISQNCYVAFGHNKYTFYSILVTTSGYLFFLVYLYISHNLNTIFSFVILSVIL